MAASTVNTNKPIIPRGVDDRPVDKYNRAELYSGKALDFDGVNDSVSVGTLSGDVYATTFLTYTDANIAASTSTQTLINFATGSGNWAFKFGASTGFLTDETFSILLPNSARVGIDKTIPKGWNHWAVCWDGSTYKIYQNGQEQETITSGTASVISMGLVELGKELSGQYFNGSLSNFKVYSTTLTAAQVADLYNNPEKIVPTGVSDSALKLWLPMQEGAGTTAYDGSGNGNHGTISGATWTHGIGAPVSQTAVIDWNKGTNLLAYSNELDNSYWTKGATTISANYATAPNGLTTADKIVSTSATGEQRIYKTLGLTTIGNTYTYQAFVKADGANYLVCRDDFRGFADTSFDLVNGVVGTIASGRTASITPIGDYYLISVSTTITSSVVLGVIMFCLADADNGRASFVGDGTKGIILWGAGINEGTSVVHIPTLATAQTSPVLLPQGLTSGRDITGVNLFENVRKQGALNLDGNSWAEVHDNASLDITSAITLEAWVYRDGESGYFGFVGKWRNNGNRCYLLATEPGNVIAFYISKNGSALVQNSYTSSATGWHHFVGTEDGTNLKFYVDGVLVDTETSISGDIFESDYNVEIGRYNNSTPNAYANQIAQPRIYNRALTASEVLNNYNATSSLYI